MAHDHCDHPCWRPEGTQQCMLAPSIASADVLNLCLLCGCRASVSTWMGSSMPRQRLHKLFGILMLVIPSSPMLPLCCADGQTTPASAASMASWQGLSVWDRPLSSGQVKSLWQTAQSRSAGGSALLAPAPAPGPQSESASLPAAAPIEAPATPSSPSTTPTQSGDVSE